LKTEAFKVSIMQYGDDAIKSFVLHHLENPGNNRNQKFQYLFDHILNRSPQPGEIESLIETFTNYIENKLLLCDEAQGLLQLRRAMSGCTWMLVSASDELQLRRIMQRRRLNMLFDGGIYGGAESKASVINNKNCDYPAILIGDSYSDYMSANDAGIDFIFVHGWTEDLSWRRWCKDEGVQVLKSVSDLMLYC